jgi:hypothetical protein
MDRNVYFNLDLVVGSQNEAKNSSLIQSNYYIQLSAGYIE